jgi:BMFP domain-containing protein YqiC
MQKTPVRKYQVVEEAEIDLVLQCRDSHEFYERYLAAFPDTKKGLDSISKIWKRKSEFAKKRPQSIHAAEAGTKSAQEIATLIADQTKILGVISALTRENFEVNRQILATLTQQNQILTGHFEHAERESPGESSHHAPAVRHPLQETASEVQAPILIGS